MRDLELENQLENNRMRLFEARTWEVDSSKLTTLVDEIERLEEKLEEIE